MIIDGHVHVYPDQAGDNLGRSRAEQRARMQALIGEALRPLLTAEQLGKYEELTGGAGTQRRRAQV